LNVEGFEERLLGSGEVLYSICKICRMVTSILDLDELLEKVMDWVVDVTGAERGAVIFSEGERLVVKTSHGIEERELEEGDIRDVVRDVIGQGKPFISTAVVSARARKPALCVPLRARDEVIGAIYLENSDTGREFVQGDVDLLLAVAMRASIRIENAMAYGEIERQKREIEELKNRLEEENIYLREEIKTEHNFEEIIGSSPALKEVLRAIERVARTSATVLIRGETGTGKELVARAIHSLSDRRDKALVKVNCPAIPRELFESELFGHERGAFTGAVSRSSIARAG